MKEQWLVRIQKIVMCAQLRSVTGSELKRILFISGSKDPRLQAKSSVMFLAEALSHQFDVKFLSLGLSALSLVQGHDNRVDLWKSANRVERFKNIDCYLWRTSVHGRRVPTQLGEAFSKILARTAVIHVPVKIKEWLSSASLIVVDSSYAISSLPIIRKYSPSSDLVYFASDDIATIGAPNHLVQTLAKYAASFKIAVAPTPLAKSFLQGFKQFLYLPHGIDISTLQTSKASPYYKQRNAVSIGSMLFDPHVFRVLGSAFPSFQFHVIGSGHKHTSSQDNVKYYEFMPFAETIPYIKYADVGIAPYRPARNYEYLVDTSLKIRQYEYFTIPVVCPSPIVGQHKESRFGYTPDDESSIISAFKKASESPGTTAPVYDTWDRYAERFIAALNWS